VDKLSGMRPFRAIGALGAVNVVIGAWRHAHGRRSRRRRFELLHDQRDRPRYCTRNAGCCQTCSSANVGNGWRRKSRPNS
jgi:hypothetical protein